MGILCIPADFRRLHHWCIILKLDPVHLFKTKSVPDYSTSAISVSSISLLTRVYMEGQQDLFLALKSPCIHPMIDEAAALILCVYVCCRCGKTTGKGLQGKSVPAVKALLFTGCFTLAGEKGISLSHSPSTNKSKENMHHSWAYISGMFRLLAILDTQHNVQLTVWNKEAEAWHSYRLI